MDTQSAFCCADEAADALNAALSKMRSVAQTLREAEPGAFSGPEERNMARKVREAHSDIANAVNAIDMLWMTT
jgi:hypothetical protein